MPELDLKKLGEERLARLAKKRKRDGSISPPALKRQTKESSVEATSKANGKAATEKLDDTIDVSIQCDRFSIPTGAGQLRAWQFRSPDNTRKESTSKVSDGLDTDNGSILASNSNTTTQFANLQYPNGAIKRTWSLYHERNNDIKIEEVLQKDKLKIAVLSSYLWDLDWLFTKINQSTTKVILVMGVETEADKRLWSDQATQQGIKVCFPDLPQREFSKMHSKLMLLFYDDSLRIVVPSANLMSYDWGETGVMENTVFLIDLPRRGDGMLGKMEDLTFFGQQLLYFLEKMELWNKAREAVLKFDFSRTENLAFVHSVAGSHYGDDMKRTGLEGLARSVRQLGLRTKDLRLDYASSSIGSLDLNTISTFHRACRGLKLDGMSSPPPTENDFLIYFPTIDTVRQSIGGIPNAGTICVQRKWWEKKDFPRSYFKDYRSKREGLLSHNKTLLARWTNHDSGSHFSWAYVGSANLSSSAWGKLVKDRSRKELKLTCANWECGVLIPGSNFDSVRDSQLESNSLAKSFEGILDVPFKEETERYRDGSEPWFFTEHQEH
jgi:hypothetical protein